jgi:hypothetical protein
MQNRMPRHRKCSGDAPYDDGNRNHKKAFGRLRMAPAYAVSGRIRSVPADGRFGAMRDATITTFHFMSIATVFAFVLMLTVGAHP